MVDQAPRWIGDQKPDLPTNLQHAADLPPLVTEQYVFFFGYTAPEPEVCFQQWYPSRFNDPDSSNPITGNPLDFHMAEQYMMYMKAVLMDDESTAEKILATPGPAEVKAFGRAVKNFDQDTWDSNCDAVVERGNFLKFSQDKQLGDILLGTGYKEIVEASPNDKIWGIGFDSENALKNKDQWGQKKALMRVRDQLQS